MGYYTKRTKRRIFQLPNCLVYVFHRYNFRFAFSLVSFISKLRVFLRSIPWNSLIDLRNNLNFGLACSCARNVALFPRRVSNRPTYFIHEDGSRIICPTAQWSYRHICIHGTTPIWAQLWVRMRTEGVTSIELLLFLTIKLMLVTISNKRQNG